jgi:hypothetical protein
VDTGLSRSFITEPTHGETLLGAAKRVVPGRRVTTVKLPDESLLPAAAELILS